MISMSSTAIGCSSASCASGEKGEADSPWKERAQSTCVVLGAVVVGSSERPSVRERRLEACEEAAVLRAVVGGGVAGGTVLGRMGAASEEPVL